jgi:hypothetical protein
LFTAAETASMRDSTQRRNYSAEAERFRREQVGRRAWGLTQRHARKMRRLHGSVAAAWTSYRDRADELLGSAVPASRAGETGPPKPDTPEPAIPEPAMSEPAMSEPALPAVVATVQVECIPIVSDITASEPVPAEPTLAKPTLADPVLADPVLAGPVLAEPAPAEAATSELTRSRTIRPQLIASKASQSAQAMPGPPGGSEPIGADPPPARSAPAASRTPPLPHRNCVTRQSRPASVTGARPVRGPGVTQPLNARPDRPDDGSRVAEDRPPRPASAIRGNARQQKRGFRADALFRWRRGVLFLRVGGGQVCVPERLLPWHFRLGRSHSHRSAHSRPGSLHDRLHGE